jgi:hypothetical protein
MGFDQFFHPKTPFSPIARASRFSRQSDDSGAAAVLPSAFNRARYFSWRRQFGKHSAFLLTRHNKAMHPILMPIRYGMRRRLAVNPIAGAFHWPCLPNI